MYFCNEQNVQKINVTKFIIVEVVCYVVKPKTNKHHFGKHYLIINTSDRNIFTFNHWKWRDKISKLRQIKKKLKHGKIYKSFRKSAIKTKASFSAKRRGLPWLLSWICRFDQKQIPAPFLAYLSLILTIIVIIFIIIIIFIISISIVMLMFMLDLKTKTTRKACSWLQCLLVCWIFVILQR